jgi:hypothetical protein
VLWPSHTPGTFHFTDLNEKEKFRQKYLARLDRLQLPLDALFSEIGASDPSAVIILHGDHGPLVTRGWSKEADTQGLYDATMVDMDRHSVLLAVRPKGLCTGKLTRVRTTADVLPELFDCLGF